MWQRFIFIEKAPQIETPKPPLLISDIRKVKAECDLLIWQTFKAVLLSAKLHYYNDLNPDICSLIAIHLVLLMAAAALGPSSDLFIAFHNVAAAARSGPKTRPRRRLPVLSLFIFMYGHQAEYYLAGLSQTQEQQKRLKSQQ